MKYLLIICLLMAFSSCIKMPPVGPINTEKDYYKLMYEQEKAQVERAHTDLFWSIGVEITVILGVMAFLLGAQYLISIRINQQALATFEARINESFTTSVREFNQRFSDIELTLGTLPGQFEAVRVELINQLESSQILVQTRAYLLEKDYQAALNQIINLLESFNNLEELPASIWWVFYNCVIQNKELESTVYEKVRRIATKTKKFKMYSLQSFIPWLGENVPVYINLPDGRKEYIKNAPAK